MNDTNNKESTEQNNISGGLCSLPRMVRQRLLRQIASVTEQAYRRGFQHGVCSGVDDDKARWFRFECRTSDEQQRGIYLRSTGAPWSDEPKRPVASGMTAIERLDIETHCSEEFTELRKLIDNVE